MPATYDSLATTTLGAAASTITFSSISSGYTDLRIAISNYRTASGTQDICLRLNGDTTSVYSFIAIKGDGTSSTSNAFTSYPRAMLAPGSWSSSTIPAFCTVDIFSYSNTAIFKTMLSQTAADYSANEVYHSVNLWRSTAAINSISIFNSTNVNIVAGTTVTLYGILRA